MASAFDGFAFFSCVLCVCSLFIFGIGVSFHFLKSGGLFILCQFSYIMVLCSFVLTCSVFV